MARKLLSSSISALIGLFALISSPAFAQESCLASAPADIVLMIDKTGSLKTSDLSKEKTAAKALLNLLSPTNPSPMVGIGTFNCPDDAGKCTQSEAARIVGGGELTAAFGSQSTSTGLYLAIDNIKNTGGYTYLNAPLKIANDHLGAHGTEAPNYIILISDGKPNRPGTSDCPSQKAHDAAINTANAVKASGTKIFTVYFDTNDGSNCPGEPSKGKNLLKSIASGPEYYFDSGSDLSGILYLIATFISCQDSDTCTADSCNNMSGYCEHSLISSSDSDQDGVLDCADQCSGADDAQIGAVCEIGVGACAATGVLVCNNPGLVCNAENINPSSELCNGIDDDCDGKVDEGFNLGSTCSVGVGACKVTGALICDAQGSTTCSASPFLPSPEICDGIDNDCDGKVDENIQPSGSCEVGVGACERSGQYACSNGIEICNAKPGQPSSESCDGVDNDCDGLTDEDFALGSVCSVGQGECQVSGTIICASNGTPTCSVTAGTPSVEICDGKDNDCDSGVDEDFALSASCSVGTGACNRVGVTICSTSGGTECSVQAGAPSQEICDGIDNDCDTIVDEDDVCACSIINFSQQIGALDGAGLSISNSVKQLAAHALKVSTKKKALKKFAQQAVADAHGIHIKIWTLVNSQLPKENMVCPSIINCTAVSTTLAVNSVEAEFVNLLKIANSVVKKFGLSKNAKTKTILKSIGKHYQSAKQYLVSFPAAVSNCS